MAVHLFGAASSPGCANFGLKHLARQDKASYPLASTFVEKNFYVARVVQKRRPAPSQIQLE